MAKTVFKRSLLVIIIAFLYVPLASCKSLDKLEVQKIKFLIREKNFQGACKKITKLNRKYSLVENKTSPKMLAKNKMRLFNFFQRAKCEKFINFFPKRISPSNMNSILPGINPFTSEEIISWDNLSMKDKKTNYLKTFKTSNALEEYWE